MTNYKTARLRVFKQKCSPVTSRRMNGVSNVFSHRWKSCKAQGGPEILIRENYLNLYWKMELIDWNFGSHFQKSFLFVSSSSCVGRYLPWVELLPRQRTFTVFRMFCCISSQKHSDQQLACDLGNWWTRKSFRSFIDFILMLSIKPMKASDHTDSTNINSAIIHTQSYPH